MFRFFLYHPAFLILIRLVLGSIFVLSGSFKLFDSSSFFLFIGEMFAILPVGTPLWVYEALRLFLSVVELLLGIMLILEVRLKWSLWFTIGLLVFFILLIVSAKVRGISINNCGCFGSTELFKMLGENDNEVLLRDIVLLGFAGWLLFIVQGNPRK